jgi:hypothetical protein
MKVMIIFIDLAARLKYKADNGFQLDARCCPLLGVPVSPIFLSNLFKSLNNEK